jgi:hypothetical protein
MHSAFCRGRRRFARWARGLTTKSQSWLKAVGDRQAPEALVAAPPPRPAHRSSFARYCCIFRGRKISPSEEEDVESAVGEWGSRTGTAGDPTPSHSPVRKPTPERRVGITGLRLLRALRRSARRRYWTYRRGLEAELLRAGVADTFTFTHALVRHVVCRADPAATDAP